MLKIERESDFQADISVVCITYNQAHLVESALNGFLEQKVNCNLEIVIHDDASTDNTAEVLKNFQRMHSDRVTLLLQSENQCKVPDVEVTCFTASHATGKYIALCEGDDYWIDPYKLQKQYDVLEANPDLSASFHSAYTETPNGERNLFAHHSEDERKFTPQEVILGDGAFMPTSGLFCRKEAFEQITRDLILTMPCGDYFFQVMASKDGGAYYFPEPMSVYRIQHAVSFSTNFSNVDYETTAKFYERMCKAVKLMDSITEYQFSSSFDIMFNRYNRSRRNNLKRHHYLKFKKLLKMV
ncbi:TPA: glycosyltransferase family 2 protein [Vibrio vulnificus]|uniref:glycosyltransferase family 2 protein n=1 Tax=Vibrio vulnificus TaxID=672 RepID=UPI001A30E8FB|nr:glycosyltransferase [Vibrio vulnificus]HDY7424530.1 glycosyltransferase [Vibrio vulnificus]HDY7496231.1 glycosyltransferase [Vibrio vulnificus]HDY7501968.1 glycosyltransferase [Vibrio vulnificus]HDY7603376.1 glycosyltransferase [Vibrio vulnificus]